MILHIKKSVDDGYFVYISHLVIIIAQMNVTLSLENKWKPSTGTCHLFFRIFNTFWDTWDVYRKWHGIMDHLVYFLYQLLNLYNQIVVTNKKKTVRSYKEDTNISLPKKHRSYSNIMWSWCFYCYVCPRRNFSDYVHIHMRAGWNGGEECLKRQWRLVYYCDRDNKHNYP